MSNNSKVIERAGYRIIDVDNKIIKERLDLTDKVLLETDSKKEHGLFGDIEVLDFDRYVVYLRANGPEGPEFMIRIWDAMDSGNESKIVWTLYKTVEGECVTPLGEKTSHYHDEKIGVGVSVIEFSEE